MSMVLMNAQAETWPAFAVAFAVLIAALLFVLNIGGNRPHS
ncbi:hypothetical protein [Luteococcus peritonei]|uniref:Uncharacterized protein n=1 Tax=Luteococcus peritonei TaxID=88874 RepID=A0ABW4RVS6_9ACTN